MKNTRTCDNREAPRLIRALGLWSAIAVIAGSMIGQAVFLVASDMARELGSPIRVLAVGSSAELWCCLELSATQSSERRCRRQAATMFTSAEGLALHGDFCMAGRVQ
jgi:hypothetical protein